MIEISENVRRKNKLYVVLMIAFILIISPFLLLAYYQIVFISKSQSYMKSYSLSKTYANIDDGYICYIGSEKQYECVMDHGDDMINRFRIGLGFRLVYFGSYRNGRLNNIHMELMSPDFSS